MAIKSNFLTVGNTTTIRNAVSSDDGSNPAVASGQGFGPYVYVEVEITIGGTTPTWDITPLLVNDAGDTYMEGETVTISGAKTHIRILKVNGTEDLNFRVDGSTGTSPTITIKGKGINS